MLPYKFTDLMAYSFGFYSISKKISKKKIFSQNFQKIELWSPVKGFRPLLPPNCLHFARYITQVLSKNIIRFINISKKKFFFLLTVDLKCFKLVFILLWVKKKFVKFVLPIRVLSSSFMCRFTLQIIVYFYIKIFKHSHKKNRMNKSHVTLLLF